MEEALLELESFQTPSRDYPHGNNDSINDSNNKNNNEPSLFFYQTESAETNESPTIFGDGSAAVLGTTAAVLAATTTENSGLSLADNNQGVLVLPEDGLAPGLDGASSSPENTVDTEGVWRARWLVVAAAALYGTNFSIVKLLGDVMPVGISTSLRFGLAALATLPWLVRGYDFGSGNGSDAANDNNRRFMATMFGLEVGLWNSLGYVSQAVGLETTLASKSAFLCSMAVVIVPLLDWITGKRLLPRQWVGALMALVGVAFLELGDVDALLAASLGGGSGELITGDALSMVQPFAFGLGFWRMEQAMHEYPEEAPRMTAAQLMAILASSIGYGLWTLGVFDHLRLPDGTFDAGLALDGIQASLATISTSFPWREWLTDPHLLFSLFWTGCITTALTVYMENLALESLSAAETTLIFSTEPLWGTAFAVAVMGEQMGLNAAAGAGLILAACLYSNLGVKGLREMGASTLESIASAAAWVETNRGKAASSVESGGAEPSSSALLRSLQDHWPWLQTGFAGGLAAWIVASDPSSGLKTQELDEIVDGLIENLMDKL